MILIDKNDICGREESQLVLDLARDALTVPRDELLPTFADCRKAYIHRWYPIIVGFSKAYVTNVIQENGLTSTS